MRSAYLHSPHVAGFAGSRPSGGAIIAAVVIVLCLVAFAFSVIWTVRAVGQDHSDGIDGDSGSDGGGGGPGGGRVPDRPGPSLGDPVWWPEFERQFADYVTPPIRR